MYSKDIYFVDWLRECVSSSKNRVEASTWEGYESYFRVHFEPYFTAINVKLKDITPKHIKDYYDRKMENGRSDGKGGLSAKTIKLHSSVLHLSLEEAVHNDLIPYNPCDRVKLPQSKEKFKGTFYTEGQANQLLEVVNGHVLEPAIILTAYYGLRRSEILGLKWESVDFDNNTIKIQNTITRITTLVEKKRTKNTSSYRTFPILENIKPYLLDLRARQNQCRLLMKSDYIENDYVCKWDSGKPISPSFISNGFKKILVKNNMPVIRFHDLRHTCASLLIAMGFSLKEVGEWLGHSDITTTNIYAHLQFQSKINMGNRLNDAIKIKVLEKC